MPLRVVFKAPFQKAFDKLGRSEQILVLKALEELDAYFKHGTAAHGLGIKKLYESGGEKTFEARVSLDLRIVWVQTKEKEEAVMALLGNHDEVRRFIRDL